MSFIGIVTRKEQDTGVTLEAKIVTPNKKKAARQKFKVKVKKTGLSDYECCVLDQASVRNKLNNQQDLTAVKEDINFTYNGEHGTRIEYQIENAGDPKITDCIGEDGKIISRPKYGKSDASGYIIMTVKKGVESITTKIRVVVKQTFGQEVLYNQNITELSLWNAIRGKNAQWANDSTSGHKNIFYNLNFINSSNQLLATDREAIAELTDEPIEISWEVTDNAINDVITENRINNTGAITVPKYKDACTLLNTNVNAELIGTTQYNKRVRIGGLTIKAIFRLGEFNRTITFDCSTCSKYITNKEVIDFAQSKTDVVLGNNMNKKLAYRMLTDSSYETVIIPATAANSQLYVGLACGTTALESFEIEDLSLQRTQVDYTFTHRICEFRKTNSYVDDDNIFSGTSITSTTREDTEHFSYDGTMTTRWPLTIDINKLASLSDNAKKSFTIETTVSATRYTKDGTSESAGGGEELKLYCHIKLDDSLVNTPSNAPSKN